MTTGFRGWYDAYVIAAFGVPVISSLLVGLYLFAATSSRRSRSDNAASQRTLKVLDLRVDRPGGFKKNTLVSGPPLNSWYLGRAAGAAKFAYAYLLNFLEQNMFW